VSYHHGLLATLSVSCLHRNRIPLAVSGPGTIGPALTMLPSWPSGPSMSSHPKVGAAIGKSVHWTGMDRSATISSTSSSSQPLRLAFWTMQSGSAVIAIVFGTSCPAKTPSLSRIEDNSRPQRVAYWRSCLVEPLGPTLSNTLSAEGVGSHLGRNAKSASSHHWGQGLVY
jgi:hypothetical protein